MTDEILPVPDLSVSISATPNPVRVRHPLTLTLVVHNAGPVTAHGVTVQKTLPPDIDLISVRSSQGRCVVAGEVITCEIGTLPLGASATVTVVVRPLRAGSLFDPELVAAAAFDPSPASDPPAITVQVLPGS
jgi:uncharacterized repeat protein (TIGR01451 family)